MNLPPLTPEQARRSQTITFYLGLFSTLAMFIAATTYMGNGDPGWLPVFAVGLAGLVINAHANRHLTAIMDRGEQ